MAKNKKPEASSKKPEVGDPAAALGGGICRVCAGEKFSAPVQISELAFAGTDESGDPYTHILRSIVKCKTCGQARVVTRYENRV